MPGGAGREPGVDSGPQGVLPAAEAAAPRVVGLEERGWLPRHCKGDAAAFPALMAAYRRPVYSYLVRAGVGPADRDDLFQSIFLKIHAGAASYEPSRPLAPWLFTIVANTVRNHLRDEGSRGAGKEAIGGTEEAEALADPDPGPERVAQAREAVAWVEAALTRLPLAQKEVLILVALVGLPQAEVAEVLDLPLNSVKTNLRRARLALAKGLAARDAEKTAAGESPAGVTHD